MNATFLLSAAAYLVKGAGVSLAIALGAIAVSGVLGLFVALCRLYGWWPLRQLTGLLVFVIKGVPLLILLIGGYFSLPYLGVDLPSAAVAVAAIGLYFAAYASEVYRAAILSIPAHQWDAGRSLGFTRAQLFQLVILPQTARFCAAPLIGLFIMAVKATSLVTAIGGWELVGAGKEIAERSQDALAAYLGIAALYFLICFGLSRLARAVEKAFSHD